MTIIIATSPHLFAPSIWGVNNWRDLLSSVPHNYKAGHHCESLTTIPSLSHGLIRLGRSPEERPLFPILIYCVVAGQCTAIRLNYLSLD
jgi:hypothetical protein